MPVVMRRVLYGKVGRGHELIERLQELNIMARQQGMAIKPRILSDYSSGRTDRVVVEWEAHSIQELYAFESELWEYEEAPELFREWFSKLAELIEYAEVETWTVH
jgi:hypothetical protein